MSLISLQNIKKSYSADYEALSFEKLSINKSSKIGIAGSTGSGKSTLLKVISGLAKPEDGIVLYNDENVYPKLDRLIPGHPQMAYLSQVFELTKFVSVFDFLDVYAHNEDDVTSISSLCRIDHLLSKGTLELSGGEKQRVALAKVLLQEPEVLLLDEPFSSLDPHHKSLMKEAVNNIEKAIDATVLIVSHDPIDILPWADEILVMKSGMLEQKGSPKEIYYQPINTYVAGLFGEYIEIQMSQWVESEDHLSLIVRPEQFSIVNSEGYSAEVLDVQFKGSYDLIIAHCNSQIIKTLAPSGQYKSGDILCIKLNIQ
ncbi:ATP-binding cassette domain-containing protein [Ekhidna sp.]